MRLGAICLRRYFSHHVQVPDSVPPPAQSLQEGEIVNLIAKLEGNKTLPIQHNQMTEFNTDENLKKIRLFKSNRVQHNEVKTKTSACSLCSRGTVQCNTARKCGTCGVPICTTSLEKDGVRCFDLWHQTEDLEQCSTDANTRLKLHREKKKNMDTYQAQMSKANAQKSVNICTICKNSSF